MATITKITINQLATLARKWDSDASSYVDPSIASVVLDDDLSELEWCDLPKYGVELIAEADTILNGVHQEGIALYRLGQYDLFIYHNNGWTMVDLCEVNDTLREHCQTWRDNQDDVPAIVLAQLADQPETGDETVTATRKTTFSDWWESRRDGVVGLWIATTANPTGIDLTHDVDTDCAEDYCDLEELLNEEQFDWLHDLTGEADDDAGRWEWDGVGDPRYLTNIVLKVIAM